MGLCQKGLKEEVGGKGGRGRLRKGLSRMERSIVC